MKSNKFIQDGYVHITWFNNWIYKNYSKLNQYKKMIDSMRNQFVWVIRYKKYNETFDRKFRNRCPKALVHPVP